jgi:hypothetical protein
MDFSGEGKLGPRAEISLSAQSTAAAYVAAPGGNMARKRAKSKRPST